VAAIEGSKASVIGGAPAAAVVFARDVRARVDRDPRVAQLEEQLETAEGADRARYRAELATLRDAVHAEKLGEVADEFDRVHDIRRAQRVGSVDAIIPARQLRPYLIEAVERGLSRGNDGGGPD
jgi:acetyl-CoA carboxylase carboxyltransferase component